jgi:hypothetical protein
MPYIYSGVCLAAMFGAILYERHLIKKEEAELCEKMRLLAERTKNDLDSSSPLTLQRAVSVNRVSQIH